MADMKQYCRYCGHLVTGNGIWCSAKQKEMSESTAKSRNSCSLFDFNPIDAFFETDGYKPREPGQKIQTDCEGQILLEGGGFNG